MARKPRIEYPGVFYHVIAQGNRREPIFGDAQDRERLLSKLSECRERYDLILYTYTHMHNHFHFLE